MRETGAWRPQQGRGTGEMQACWRLLCSACMLSNSAQRRMKQLAYTAENKSGVMTHRRNHISYTLLKYIVRGAKVLQLPWKPKPRGEAHFFFYCVGDLPP